MRKKILILNGSLGDHSGNTARVLDLCNNIANEKDIDCEIYHLKNLLEKSSDISAELESLRQKIARTDGFIFSSGTYWDSWGSPMQFFLEKATIFEASSLFMAKPAAVVITMHSVGGKGVLSRLQGVLNTLGFLIPPMSGMVYALSTQLALQHPNSFAEDFWSLEDLEIIMHNLITSMNNSVDFLPWTVDKKDPTRIWFNNN